MTEQLTEERRQELTQALDHMQAVADDFYIKAIHVGVHPFIEFNGLQQEYIKACRMALERGIDFADCNQHTGAVLPLENYMLDYILEKLTCIFTKKVSIDGYEGRHRDAA